MADQDDMLVGFVQLGKRVDGGGADGSSLHQGEHHPHAHKRKRELKGQHRGSDPLRWIISYADFITLLLAFFIAMYAMVHQNDAQRKLVQEALIKVFDIDPSNLNMIDLPGLGGGVGLGDVPTNAEQLEEALRSYQTRLRFVQISQKIEEALISIGEQGSVTIRRSDTWLEIELASGLLFESASAELKPQIKDQLATIGSYLAKIPYHLNVEGHTDNLPISTVRFPSNWELSAARAAAVGKQFIKEGVRPENVTILGYSSTRPKADNSSPQGRAENRRVLVTVIAGPDPRIFYRQLADVKAKQDADIVGNSDLGIMIGGANDE